MAKAAEPPADPPPYPDGGSFGKLLNWHLDWGTKPSCKTATQNKPWVRSHFAQFVHEEGMTLASAARNLRNWTNHGMLPDEQGYDNLAAIFRELFGNDPNLNRWKADLEHALASGRKQQTDRIAKRAVFEPWRIPYPAAHFLGRDEMVDALANALATSESSRAILIQGGPGIGKTELTKAIAHHPDIIARFCERRYFVPLDAAHSAADLQMAIIRAIGGDPAKDLTVALQRLHGRDSLLVLDNLETPWEPANEQKATESVLTDVMAVSGIAVIASIRGTQFVGGCRWNFQPLDELLRTHAMDLFASIAGEQVRDDPVLAKFMTVLGGLPLAIDLVARRARGRASLMPLWSEWEKVGTEFASDSRFEAGRLSSLDQSIELSLKSLRSPDRDHPALRLFSFLGALPAGLTGGDTGFLMAEDAFKATERLCHIGIAVERGDRLGLLSSIREHALRLHPLPTAAIAACSTYFLNKISELEKVSLPAADIILEFANIEVAIRADIVLTQGNEAMRWVRRLDYRIRSSHVNTTVFEELLPYCRAADNASAEADCEMAQGHVALGVHNHNAAEEAFARAFPLYKRQNDVRGAADCALGTGQVAWRKMDLKSAHAGFFWALKLHEQLGDQNGMAAGVAGMARVAAFQRNFEYAKIGFTHALDLMRQCGAPSGIASSLLDLGEVAHNAGDYPTAETTFEEAREIYRSSGDRHGEARALVFIADVDIVAYDKDAAEQHFQEALPLFEETMDELGKAACLFGLGNVALILQADPHSAERFYNEALAIFQRCNNLQGQANCLMRIGDVRLRTNDLRAAQTGYEAALQIYTKNQDKFGEEICRRKLAELIC